MFPLITIDIVNFEPVVDWLGNDTGMMVALRNDDGSIEQFYTRSTAFTNYAATAMAFSQSDAVSATPTPEPASIALVALLLASCTACRYRR